MLEILKARRRELRELLLAEGVREGPDIAHIDSLARRQGVPCRLVARAELERELGEVNHQGVAVRCGRYAYGALDEILARAEKQERGGIVLILDHLEDPQNLGSLLRTAESAGVLGVILPEDRAVGVTPAVVRASAGAAEHIPVARVVNLVRAMKTLQEAAFWLTGLEAGEGARPYTEVDFTGRVGLVVGSEGCGMRRLVRESCDFLAELPQLGKINSLNAAIAGAIALYEVVRQQRL